ncbi:MAG TPA: hypothetical protein VJT74_07445 [Pyrinomonadaceae bacterium]|nr:hypothetical protein [Pyrinomonadaceae bacterium]
MAFDKDEARAFVKSVDLSGTPRGLVTQDAATEAGEIFDQAKNQAQVVGSGLFSFAQGVDAKVREAISDSALLAQLVANKRFSQEESPLEWFKEYSEVLQKVGWTLQDSGWTDYTTSGKAAEVHEKILEVMAVALGPAPAALAIITATVNALKGMKPDSSWLTIFSRESQKSSVARFQIGLVETQAEGDVFVSLLACLVQAQNTITQVLFFKYKDAKASFRANSAKVSINNAALTDLGPGIRSKVRAYQADYLSSILDV